MIPRIDYGHGAGNSRLGPREGPYAMLAVPKRQVFRAYEAGAPRVPEPPGFCSRCGTPRVIAHCDGRQRPTCPSCGHVVFRNPASAVAIVILRHGHVLLGLRVPSARFGGRWGFPAGYVEFDEDFLTAARREAREETGLEVVVTGIIDVTSNHLTPTLHALVIALAAEPVGGALTAGDDLCELRWVPFAGPHPPLAYEADAHLLLRLAHGAVPLLPVDAHHAAPR